MTSKKLFLACFLSLFAIACFGNEKKNASIHVNFKGFDTGYIIFETTQIDEVAKMVKPEICDTVIVQNGKAVLNPQINNFAIISMRFVKKFNKYSGYRSHDSNEINLFAYPGEKINVDAQIFEDYTVDYKLTGNAFNKEYSKYRGTLTPDYRIFNTTIKESPNPIKRPQELQDKIDKALDATGTLREEYYNSHSNTPLGAFLYIKNMYYYFRKFPDNKLAIKELGPNALNSLFGIYCNDVIEKDKERDKMIKEFKIQDSLNKIEMKKIEANPAPDFTVKDITGKDITLSSFRGKYVVLDLWYIGCQFCPRSIEGLRNYSKKYPGKFEVITININDSLDKLQTAVKDLGMEEFINTMDNNQAVYKMFKCLGVPTEILIHPAGKVEYLQHGFERLDQLFGNTGNQDNKVSFTLFK